jgi:hypothetical protein
VNSTYHASPHQLILLLLRHSCIFLGHPALSDATPLASSDSCLWAECWCIPRRRDQLKWALKEKWDTHFA